MPKVKLDEKARAKNGKARAKNGKARAKNGKAHTESNAKVLLRTINVCMAREDVGTQKQLGCMLGMSTGKINKRLTRRTKWEHDDLCNLFSALNFTDEEILVSMGRRK